MKKLLFLGVNKKTHTTQRIIEELNKIGLNFDFFKWSELVFESGALWARNKKIYLAAYSAAFLDSPGYNLVEKGLPRSKKRLSRQSIYQTNSILSDVFFRIKESLLSMEKPS